MFADFDRLWLVIAGYGDLSLFLLLRVDLGFFVLLIRVDFGGYPHLYIFTYVDTTAFGRVSSRLFDQIHLSPISPFVRSFV